MPATHFQGEGEIYAHVCENADTGLERGLYWNIFLSLSRAAPVESLAIDWLTWPIARWRDLPQMRLSACLDPSLVEVSAYIKGEHRPAHLSDLVFYADRGATLRTSLEIALPGELATGRDPLTVSSALRLAGVVVVPGSLATSPTSAADVAETVRHFISLDGLAPPLWDEWRYILPAAAEA